MLIPALQKEIKRLEEKNLKNDMLILKAKKAMDDFDKSNKENIDDLISAYNLLKENI